MTEQELVEIEQRHLQALPRPGEMPSFDDRLKSVRDVPALVAEVRRLWDEVEEATEIIRRLVISDRPLTQIEYEKGAAFASEVELFLKKQGASG